MISNEKQYAIDDLKVVFIGPPGVDTTALVLPPGGRTSYSLVEKGGVTVLTIGLHVPPGQEDTLKNSLPEAITRVKILTEE